MPNQSDGGNLKVVRHDPVRERRIRIAIVVSVLVLAVAAYWGGGSKATNQSQVVQQENDALVQRNADIEAENDRLRQRIVILESTGKIDKEATNRVRTLVRQLEDEKAGLNKDLTFYKSIMAPEDVSKGVRIAGLDLISGTHPRHFRIRLVVSQVARSNPFLKGTLAVSVIGKNNDKTESVPIQKLAGLTERTIALGFRYFQSLPENRDFLDFELPEDFTPESIKVVVRIRSGAVQNLEKIYQWDEELATDVQQEQTGS